MIIRVFPQVMHGLVILDWNTKAVKKRTKTSMTHGLALDQVITKPTISSKPIYKIAVKTIV